MEIIYAVALFGAAIIIATIVYLGSRMPVTPKWASDTLVANFWCVLIIGLLAFGIGLLVQYVVYRDERILGLREIAISGIIVAGYVLLWSSLGVRRRLARYAQARKNLAQPGVAHITGAPDTPLSVPPDDRVPPKAA